MRSSSLTEKAPQRPDEVHATAPLASKTPRKDDKIPSLDGLRAASMLLVFFFHAFPGGGWLGTIGGVRLAIPGAFGVTVFFFLSGFLITTLLRREYDGARRVSFRAFYMRRVLRIYPTLLAAMLFFWCACVAGLLPSRLTITTAGVALLQISNYWIVWHGQESLGPGMGVLWSLAVEEHFYLFFPLLYVALRRRIREPSKQALVLLAMCAVVLVWRLVFALALDGDSLHLRIATDTRLDSILFGCALAIFGNPVLDSTRFTEKTWKIVFVPLGFVGMLGCYFIPGERLRESLKYTIEGLALVPVFVTGVRYPTWGPFRILNKGPVAFLGVLSYSVYLVHGVLLKILEDYAHSGVLVMVVGGFAGSVGVAWIIHLFVEGPSGRLRRGFTGARSALPASQNRVPLAKSQGGH